jgi:Ca2+-binding RTX toxin-like protein
LFQNQKRSADFFRILPPLFRLSAFVNFLLTRLCASTTFGQIVYRGILWKSFYFWRCRFWPLCLALIFGGGDDEQDTAKTVNGGNADDSIRGSDFADQIGGNGGDDTLRGFGGDDTLRGGLGSDVIDGGAGNDVMRGGADGDLMLGLTGNDTIYGDGGDDAILGEDGNDLMYMGAGNDLGWAEQKDFAEGYEFGQLGDDTIYGEAGNDVVYDYAGRNTIFGGTGDDALSTVDLELGRADIRTADAVYGGAGNDALYGDYGDTLSGGAGNDTIRAFALVSDNQANTIEGYNSAEDALQIIVDPSIANAATWKLASTTDTQTGDIAVFLQNIATPATVIDLALMKSPTNFQLSQIDLKFEAAETSA